MNGMCHIFFQTCNQIEMPLYFVIAPSIHFLYSRCPQPSRQRGFALTQMKISSWKSRRMSVAAAAVLVRTNPNYQKDLLE